MRAKHEQIHDLVIIETEGISACDICVGHVKGEAVVGCADGMRYLPD